ncbi:hypothetical protein ACI797_15445 [Geodermatophilus sp. SYSU D00691]
MKRRIVLVLTAAAAAFLVPAPAQAGQGGEPHLPTQGSCGIGRGTVDSPGAHFAIRAEEASAPGASDFRFQLEPSAPFPPPYCTPPGGRITG